MIKWLKYWIYDCILNDINCKFYKIMIDVLIFEFLSEYFID